MDKCIRQRGRWPIVAAFVIQAALSAPAAVTAATLQVSLSGVDVGNCTAVACLHISYAIGQANDGDTITVAAGTYGESNLAIAKSITIAGAGPATTTVDAGYVARVFAISVGKTVTISGVTITRGYPGRGNSGGGILNQGTLTLTNDTVTDNWINSRQDPAPPNTTVRAYGAAIFNDANAKLTVNGTTVSNNVAGMPPVAGDPNDPLRGGDGGGIATQGTVTINDSIISGNQATVGGVGSGSGGGIFMVSPATNLTITNSLITANRTDTTGVAINVVFDSSGLSLVTLDHVTVSNHTNKSYPAISLGSVNLAMRFTTLTGNASVPLIFAGSSAAVSYAISDSTISNNTDRHYSSAGMVLSGSGGSIARTVITGNHAVDTTGPTPIGTGTGGLFLIGSGQHTISDSQITGNSGTVGGATLREEGFSTYTISNTIISNNVSVVFPTFFMPETYGAGGVDASGVDALTITNSTISGNSTLGDGGGIIAYGTTTISGTTINGNSAVHGSGVLVQNSGLPTTTLINSTVSGNTSGTAIENVRGVVVLKDSTVAGNATGVTNQATSGGTFTVTNSILSNAGPNCALGSIHSGGYNVVSDVSCGFSGTDLTSTDPNIAALAQNGGPTATHALNPGSPAIDRIPSAGGCNGSGVTTDQRGVPRPSGSGCDVGAYEVGVLPNVPDAPTAVVATAGNAQASVTFAAPANNGGSAITGYAVTSHPAGGTDSNAGSTATTHTVIGLSNGTPYNFTVTASNIIGTGIPSAASNTVTPSSAPSAPVLVSAVSRKVHFSVGPPTSGPVTYDMPLSAVTTSPTTEPRIGPAQTIVFTFNKTVNGATVTITEGIAVSGGPTFSGNDVIVNLTGVNNQQYVTIALTNVVSPDGGTGGGGSVRVGFLLADVNQSRVVTLADLGLINAQLSQPVTSANYLKDVNASNTISLGDKGIANANLTKSLPAP